MPANEFAALVLGSKSIADILRHFGFTHSGQVYKSIHERIKADGLSCDHMHTMLEGNTNPVRRVGRTPLSQILVEHSTYSRRYLKKRLIRDRIIENKCSICDISNEWNGMPLCLQLDHINGINTDNRLVNLRLICPNCHSQTATFAGRNQFVDKPKTQCNGCGKETSGRGITGYCHLCAPKELLKSHLKPSKDELTLLLRTMTTSDIANKYEVSESAARKWCKQSNIPKPVNGWNVTKYKTCRNPAPT